MSEHRPSEIHDGLYSPDRASFVGAPEFRDDGDGGDDGDDDSDQEVRCDGGDPPEQEDTDTQTVDIVGPTRFRYELTDEELERVKESDSPIFEIDQEPVEWEPASGEWEVNDG